VRVRSRLTHPANLTSNFRRLILTVGKNAKATYELGLYRNLWPPYAMRTDPTNQSRPHHAPHLFAACDVHTSGSHSRSPRRDTSSVRMGRTLGGSSQGACSGGSLAGRCLYRKNSSPDTSAIALLRDHPAHSSSRCASDARADSNPVRSAGACTQGRAPSEAAPGATPQGRRPVRNA
jgi:hypothetical protein